MGSRGRPTVFLRTGDQNPNTQRKDCGRTQGRCHLQAKGHTQVILQSNNQIPDLKPPISISKTAENLLLLIPQPRKVILTDNIIEC